MATPSIVSASSNPNILCALSSTPLLFGDIVPYDGMPEDSTATITITCTTSGVAAEHWEGIITLSGAETPAGRQLKQGHHPLAYRLYLDPGRRVPWDVHGGESGGMPVSGMVGPLAPYRQTIILYGRIPSAQRSATVGRYSDTVNALLEY